MFYFMVINDNGNFKKFCSNCSFINCSHVGRHWISFINFVSFVNMCYFGIEHEILRKRSNHSTHGQNVQHPIYTLFLSRVSLRCPSWPRTHLVTQAVLAILLLLPFTACQVARVPGLYHWAQQIRS